MMAINNQSEVDKINEQFRRTRPALPTAVSPAREAEMIRPRGMSGVPSDASTVPTTPEAVAAARAARQSAISRGVAIPASVETILAGEQANVSRRATGAPTIKKLAIGESAPSADVKQKTPGPVPYSGGVDRSARVWGPNVVPASYFTGGMDPALSRQLSAAREAAAQRGDWDAVNRSYGPGGLRGDWVDPLTQPKDVEFDPGTMSLGELAGAAVKSRRAAGREKLAGEKEIERMRQKSALDIARTGRDPEESAARARLLGKQADVAGYTEQNLRRDAEARKILEAAPGTYSAGVVSRARAHVDKAKQDRLDTIMAQARAKWMAENEGFAEEPAQALATGGVVKGYADGGAVSAYGAAPQPNPLLAQYGQYLQAASQSKVPPVPFEQYVNLLASTRSQMGQTPSQFADGGEVPGYTRPSDVDWGGVLRRGISSLMGAGQVESAAATQPAPQPQTDPTKGFWALDPEKQREIEESVRQSRGYAEGGAIDVSGKKLVGPGTGTSDSIPAVIDGNKPAALSSGEFVIPAHVVRAKGTEFFDKLIAAYADNKGQGNGE